MNILNFVSQIHRAQHPPQHVVIRGDDRHELSEAAGHRLRQLQQAADVPHLPQGDPRRLFQLHAASECHYYSEQVSVIITVGVIITVSVIIVVPLELSAYLL